MILLIIFLMFCFFTFLLLNIINQNQEIENSTEESLQEFFDSLENDFYNEIQPLDIKIENVKILLLSDFHIGKIYDINETIPLLFKEIERLIKFEFPDYIFLLGDLVDGNCPNIGETYVRILTNIIKLHKKTFIIGGNHDRQIVDIILQKAKLPSSIVLSKERFFLLDTKPKLFIGHDWYYNQRVRDNITLSFMKNIRERTEIMNDDDYMIIGHTHTQICDEKKLSCSIGQFSIDENSYKYSIIITRKIEPMIILDSIEPLSQEL